MQKKSSEVIIFFKPKELPYRVLNEICTSINFIKSYITIYNNCIIYRQYFNQYYSKTKVIREYRLSFTNIVDFFEEFTCRNIRGKPNELRDDRYDQLIKKIQEFCLLLLKMRRKFIENVDHIIHAIFKELFRGLCSISHITKKNRNFTKKIFNQGSSCVSMNNSPKYILYEICKYLTKFGCDWLNFKFYNGDRNKCFKQVSVISNERMHPIDTISFLQYECIEKIKYGNNRLKLNLYFEESTIPSLLPLYIHTSSDQEYFKMIKTRRTHMQILPKTDLCKLLIMPLKVIIIAHFIRTKTQHKLKNIPKLLYIIDLFGSKYHNSFGKTKRKNY